MEQYKIDNRGIHVFLTLKDAKSYLGINGDREKIIKVECDMKHLIGVEYYPKEERQAVFSQIFVRSLNNILKDKY